MIIDVDAHGEPPEDVVAGALDVDAVRVETIDRMGHPLALDGALDRARA